MTFTKKFYRSIFIYKNFYERKNQVKSHLENYLKKLIESNFCAIYSSMIIIFANKSSSMGPQWNHVNMYVQIMSCQ